MWYPVLHCSATRIQYKYDKATTSSPLQDKTRLHHAMRQEECILCYSLLMDRLAARLGWLDGCSAVVVVVVMSVSQTKPLARVRRVRCSYFAS